MKRTMAAALLVILVPLPGRAEDAPAPAPAPAKEHWTKTYVGTGVTLVAAGALLTAYGYTGETSVACPDGGGCSTSRGRKGARIAGVGLAALGAGVLIVGKDRAGKTRSPQVGFVPGLRSGMVWVSF